MTHEGFLRIPHTNKNFDLIIDEILNPYGLEEIQNFDQKQKVAIDFSNFISWTDASTIPLEKPEGNKQPFFELTFTSNSVPGTVNKELWMSLSNTNYKLWATWETGNNIISNAVENSIVVKELDPELLNGWRSVWIAAAVFEKTLMSMWLLSNNMQYSIVYPFTTHRKITHWHSPEAPFSWSKTYKNNHPEVESLFRDYITKNKSGKFLYSKNNSSNIPFMGGIQVKHNAHGLNIYSNLNDFAFASAIKSNPFLKNFIQFKTGSGLKEFEFAFTGYMAYQLVMRISLRDPNSITPVNLFFLDTTQMNGVMDLFDINYFMEKINSIKRLLPSESIYI
jgi:hypothetical protein